MSVIIQSKIIKAVKRSENMTQRLIKITSRNDRHDRTSIHLKLLQLYSTCSEAIGKTETRDMKNLGKDSNYTSRGEHYEV